MSEKTSRKRFLFAAGTAITGWLAYCGLSKSVTAKPAARTAEAVKQAVDLRPEPRAVPLRRA